MSCEFAYGNCISPYQFRPRLDILLLAFNRNSPIAGKMPGRADILK